MEMCTFAELRKLHDLTSDPAFAARERGTGMTIRLWDKPQAWKQKEGRRVEKEVIEHIGRRYIFSREDPGAATKSPFREVQEFIPRPKGPPHRVIARQGGE